jgi:predicted TIM-barrel fold metal-dependent hydrolase
LLNQEHLNSEALMDEYHKEGITRRDLMMFGAAAAAGVAGSLPLAVSSANAAEPVAGRGARFLLDCHVHVGGSPGLAALIDQVQSPKDYLALRGKQPKVFAAAASEPQIDNSDDLIAVMKKHGVTHGLIQPTPGRNASNERVAQVARNHKDRFFPLYRPEAALGALGTGTMEPPTKEECRANAQAEADAIENVFPKLGMFGMGEFGAGGYVTTALDPIEISRDMGPIMEALRPKKLPIMLPTGSSGWKGSLIYIYEPIWVDELAGNFPGVPIVLTKMGRSIPTSFDACLTIAKRNANIYFDLTETNEVHLREAIDQIGAHRIMFGTDLSGLSVNYTYEHGLHTVDGINPTAEEREWISWRTADTVYQLGLEG